MKLKTCTKCRRSFEPSASHFYKRAQSRDGLTYRCITCIKAYDQQRYATRLKFDAAWQARNRENTRRWYQRMKANNLAHARLKRRRRAYYHRNARQIQRLWREGRIRRIVRRRGARP